MKNEVWEGRQGPRHEMLQKYLDHVTQTLLRVNAVSVIILGHKCKPRTISEKPFHLVSTTALKELGLYAAGKRDYRKVLCLWLLGIYKNFPFLDTPSRGGRGSIAQVPSRSWPRA